INISIQNLFYENIKLATAKVILINSGNNLIIESGNIIGNTTNTTFSGVNYCIECGPDKAFVNLDINMQLNDIGKMVTSLGYPNLVAGGTGKLNANLQWNGKIQNFSLANTIGSINANFKDGKLLKVRTGNFLGEIIGLINLQTITSLAHLDFTHAVSNGFYFYLLKFNAYIFNNVLNIKSLYMSGPLANVYLYGTININNEAIDAYMSIVPKVSAGIAVGAAAATLNPLVGIAVYIAEWVLDQPFNKLLSFSYHLTGNLKHVNLTKVNISQQIINNINSTLTLDGK
ncbi:MAG: hypothetical protein ORN24_04850, partial [Burkholderiales bacterium]|nr:hypothetical protein [Burkholderiales bacterium]